MDKVLVVDDEKLICEGMRRALEGLALFQVHTAASGLEALKLLETEDIQGMLLDIANARYGRTGVDAPAVPAARTALYHDYSGYEEFAYASRR